MRPITLGGIVTRYLFAFGLVCLTWNPSPVNFFRWAVNQWDELTPLVAFVGLALLIGWIVFLRATLRALGLVGILLAAGLAAITFWIIVDYDLIDIANHSVVGWVALTLLAAILTAGMSWSHLRRRWSGQADVDDIEDVGH